MVEVIIASAIMGSVIIGIINAYRSLVDISLQNTEKIQSTFLIEEGVEAVRVMRDTSWSNIASSTVGTTYYLKWRNGNWTATTTPQIVDIFTRTIVYSNAYRDGSFNLVESGGTADTNSRKATVSVAWPGQAGTTTRSVDLYIFKTFNN